MKRVLVAGILLAGGCGGGDATLLPVTGAFTRAGYHLTLSCPHETPQIHDADLLYPIDSSAHTFTVRHAGGETFTMRWDNALLATGTRDGNAVDFVFTRHDPFTPEHSEPWIFRGRVRDDFAFHERVIVGQIESGTFDDGSDECTILPRSVAWFTTRPTLPPPVIPSRRGAKANGTWNRFVWFLDIGPLGIERKGDPGQRGQSVEVFQFASTGGGQVAAGDEVSFVDDGFPQDGGGLHPGAASGSSVSYRSTNADWDVDVGQDVLWDDGLPRGTSPGVHRLLAGFVVGTVRVDPSLYPAGWTGATGMVPLQRAGLAFFLDLDTGPGVPQRRAVGVSPPRLVREGPLRLRDGIPVTP